MWHMPVMSCHGQLQPTRMALAGSLTIWTCACQASPSGSICPWIIIAVSTKSLPFETIFGKQLGFTVAAHDILPK